MNRNLLFWLSLGAVLLIFSVIVGFVFFDLRRVVFPTDEEKFVDEMRDRANSGGFSATFSDGESGKWKIAPGHKVERMSVGSSGAVVARLTSTDALVRKPSTWESQGLSIVFPVSMAQRFSGRQIEIGIVARSSSSNGTPQFSALYATQQAGNSGWKDIPVGPKFELKTFYYDVPRVETGYKYSPMLVIHSDAQGSGKALEMLGIYVREATAN